MTRVLPYVWYPTFFVIALVLFGSMLSAGTHLMFALYAPIIVVGFAIVALELLDPERRDWRPRWGDVKNDALFMAFVQIALPRVLSVLLVLATAAWASEHMRSEWWPHAWPLAAQALLMLLAVDLLRYWLHRACHSNPLLWRLHEVHHSPDILYTLNVARFHPLEKVLHFSLDTVPFVLLGISPEILAAYLLLYSVNGLFQHSNVRLRYGWLNYMVGSAETHRWHHARDPGTAYCNFGNTTIVWDLVFGTWYLPANRSLDIGIPDRHYPKDFLSQMLTPFRSGIAKPHFSLQACFTNLVIALHLRFTWLASARRIAAASRDPMRAQRKLLARIVNDNRDTRIGLEHGFGAIRSYEEFTRRVPVLEYESLRPYIDAEIERGEKALTAEAPERYLRTSGTTGRAKDIPVTHSHLRALHRINLLAVACQHRVCPEAFAGSILTITGSGDEGTLLNGKTFGSASGIVSDSTPRPIRRKFVLPAQVNAVSDSRTKYLLILRLALACRDITYLGTANPSTLLTLLKLYREYEDHFLQDLRNGGFFLENRLDPAVRAAVCHGLRAIPERAQEIEALRRIGPELRIADLWPDLRLVVTWTCASAGVAVSALKAELAPRTRIHELGYLASEYRATVTFGRRSGSGLATFETHFFEFVEREKWDRGEPEFFTLGGIRKGVDYYVIVTTPSGLYRYFINDLVRVTSFLHKMPLLKFMQKGKGVTNITGEKLYESQMLAAVNRTLEKMGRGQHFVMMLADVADCRYKLYIEADAGPKPDAAQLAKEVDTQLQDLNVEYKAKRESERLGVLSAAWLAPGTEEAFKQECVRRGQREGQFKTIALAYKDKLPFDFEAFVERDE